MAEQVSYKNGIIGYPQAMLLSVVVPDRWKRLLQTLLIPSSKDIFGCHPETEYNFWLLRTLAGTSNGLSGKTLILGLNLACKASGLMAAITSMLFRPTPEPIL